jgi:hypothetical protein
MIKSLAAVLTAVALCLTGTVAVVASGASSAPVAADQWT